MSTRYITSTLLALVLGAAALAHDARAQDYKPPLYRAARAQDEIRVDGKLDEFTWAALPRVGRFIDIRQHDNPDALDTQATLAWDNTNLYIAFSCVDPEPWGTLMQRDQHLWNEEVVEVFLDPDGDGHNYPELEVSPHNIVVDLLIPHRPDQSTDASIAARWDIQGLQTAVGKYAAGWTVEIAIPWASLAESGVSTAPQEGDRWRVGLYRIERPGGPSRATHIEELQKKLDGVPAGEQTALRKELKSLQDTNQDLAWSPTRHTFHDPERFGIVEFVLRP
jgi:Carbohydrate family 9 binding domain-like